MNSRQLIITIIAVLALGFTFGQRVGASIPEPGSEADPLVTKSYVDRLLQESCQGFKEQAAYLSAEVRSLEERVSKLEARYSPPVVLTLGSKTVRIGQDVKELEVAPYTKNGRTMLPFRFIGEFMGAKVSWEKAAGKVTFELSGKEVVLTIGSKTALAGGQPVTLDVAPELTNGSTMVPVRFIVDGLGAQLDWNAERQQITIYP